jgi:hypothetical protein
MVLSRHIPYTPQIEMWHLWKLNMVVGVLRTYKSFPNFYTNENVKQRNVICYTIASLSLICSV